MQRNYLPFAVLAYLAFALPSCEVPIEIESDSKIVVQSYFSNNQDLLVYVTESSNRSINSTEPIYVENAAVTLFSGDGKNFLTGLPLIAEGDKSFYRTENFQPEIETIYMLRVEVPGHDPVTATNSIPQPVTLNEVDLSNSAISNGVDEQMVKFDIAVTVEDPAPDDNFYHILFSQELTDIEDGSIHVLKSHKDLHLTSHNKLYDVIQLGTHPSFLLKDELFNGQSILLTFSAQYSFDPDKYERGDFRVEMRTVSDAYYQHYLSFLNARPIGNSTSPNIDDYLYDDNINNGSGVFAGYSSSIKNVRVPN